MEGASIISKHWESWTYSSEMAYFGYSDDNSNGPINAIEAALEFRSRFRPISTNYVDCIEDYKKSDSC